MSKPRITQEELDGLDQRIARPVVITLPPNFTGKLENVCATKEESKGIEDLANNLHRALWSVFTKYHEQVEKNDTYSTRNYHVPAFSGSEVYSAIRALKHLLNFVVRD